jgi:hypothetical protein
MKYPLEITEIFRGIFLSPKKKKAGPDQTLAVNILA